MPSMCSICTRSMFDDSLSSAEFRRWTTLQLVKCFLFIQRTDSSQIVIWWTPDRNPLLRPRLTLKCMCHGRKLTTPIFSRMRDLIVIRTPCHSLRLTCGVVCVYPAHFSINYHQLLKFTGWNHGGTGRVCCADRLHSMASDAIAVKDTERALT